MSEREEAARARVEKRIADAVQGAPPLPADLERRLRELIVLAWADGDEPPPPTREELDASFEAAMAMAAAAETDPVLAAQLDEIVVPALTELAQREEPHE